MAKTNVEQMVEAGVLDASQMTDELKEHFNTQLTQAEVENLISAKQKIGGDPWKPKVVGHRPNGGPIVGAF